MAQIISATTQFKGKGLTGSGMAKQRHFLGKAVELLAQARKSAAEGRMEEALEYAYQAGLRTAGARVAVSTVAQRRRKPSSAWEQLMLVSDGDAQWAKDFGRYSRLRARVASGLEDEVSDAVVYEVMDLAARFVDDTEAFAAFGDLAA